MYNRQVPMNYKEEEIIFKALANRRRIAIVAYLKNKKEAHVGNIAVHIKLSFNATSKHLKILYLADILDKEQRALLMFYKISDSLPKSTKQLISIL